MINFLEKNYPVSRIKINHRFKRAIVLDNGSIFILNQSTNMNQLKFQLINILTKVFSCEEIISINVLNNFLRLT